MLILIAWLINAYIIKHKDIIRIRNIRYNLIHTGIYIINRARCMITHASWHLAQSGYLHPESLLSFLVSMGSMKIIRKMPQSGGLTGFNVLSLSPDQKQMPCYCVASMSSRAYHNCNYFIWFFIWGTFLSPFHSKLHEGPDNSLCAPLEPQMPGTLPCPEEVITEQLSNEWRNSLEEPDRRETSVFFLWK